MTADLATDFDGDYFSRSFRMHVPLMPKTGEFKLWKRDFLSFLSIKAAPQIPQLAMSSFGVPMNPVAMPTLCSYIAADITNLMHKLLRGFLLGDLAVGQLHGK
jgi:hypothetical protein